MPPLAASNYNSTCNEQLYLYVIYTYLVNGSSPKRHLGYTWYEATSSDKVAAYAIAICMDIKTVHLVGIFIDMA